MDRFDELVIANEIAEVGINSLGGYVTSWRVKDGAAWRDILYVGSSIKRGGIPVLFPYFGKAEKWPQHGFGRNCQWKIVATSGNRIEMELRSEDVSDEYRSWYPYTFTTRIAVEIDSNGYLLYSLEIKNMSDRAMPISPGLHPYWAMQHADKREIVVDGVSAFEANNFDWNESPPDNQYDFSRRGIVRLPAHDITIEDVTDEPVIKHVMIWSLTPVRDADYDFVCVEPICGGNYAIDRTPLLVASGAVWKMDLRFSVTQRSTSVS